MRSIRAIGYDMDYTLIHYSVEVWEKRAFDYLKDKFLEMSWPVEKATFDPSFVVRGLIIDKKLGNIVKANRFGYIKLACHGKKILSFEQQRKTYSQVIVDLTDDRWVFLNTFFSISETNMYAHLVDLFDNQKLNQQAMGYEELYNRVKTALGEAHMEGRLKTEIMADPKRFVILNKDTPITLLDQKEAGKKLMLITNSDYKYSNAMMSYAFDQYLPKGTSWKDLFEIIIVSAQKPDFFSGHRPIFKVIDEKGTLVECPTALDPNHKTYLGGNALIAENFLGFAGSEILYIGDHIYSDVHVSKSIRRWRTALIIRELQDELLYQEGFKDQKSKIDVLMNKKKEKEFIASQIKLLLQRYKAGYHLTPDKSSIQIKKSIEELQKSQAQIKKSNAQMQKSLSLMQKKLKNIREELQKLDEEITPLVIKSGELYNKKWGLLMRTGNDKSYLARQIERHADIYTSCVSNFMLETPFVFIRSYRGTLPHDQSE